MEYLTNLNMKAAFNVAQLCSQKMVKAKNRKKIGGFNYPYVFTIR